VATIDEVVLGVLELRLPAYPGGTGEVRQVYVVPGARELGLGDEMLAAAIEATVAAGGATIEAVALPGDRETKNLFERSGLTARLITVSKRLG
jgi:ribosomal protein S18 acetylase RimI-like enzyme